MPATAYDRQQQQQEFQDEQQRGDADAGLLVVDLVSFDHCQEVRSSVVVKQLLIMAQSLLYAVCRKAVWLLSAA